MSIRNLDRFFRPTSVALVGASERPHSIGATILSNLLTGGFAGRIMPVNSARDKVQGLDAWRSVDVLPACPDLAVICTPPNTIPEIVRQLGKKGTRTAVVVSAGLGQNILPDGRSAAEAMLQAARPHLLRILGPNCLGMLVPGIGLNASFAPAMAKAGKLAFISQSGALATAVLDWGNAEGIGFSCFLSIGDSLDVDMGDLIDYLARDPETSAILLYIESIKNPRKFMSAARAASRAKPLIAVKAGRASAGARAAFSHTGALAGDDDIVDAFLRRAGILRVDTTRDLFSAAAVLARAHPYRGPRVALMTNGGGAGVMATDALIARGGALAKLSEQTLATLDAKLPATWSRANPLDIIGDAPVERYAETLRTLIDAPEADSVLFLHAPTAIVESEKIAEAVLPIIAGSSKDVFTCFLGGERVSAARHLLRQHGVLGFQTPEEAVEAILQRQTHAALKTLLAETPSAFEIDPEVLVSIRGRVRALLDEGKTTLGAREAGELLAQAGFRVVQTIDVSSVEEAVQAATRIGFPVALKILSPDISHKSDVGGVVLGIGDAEALRQAATRMEARISAMRPNSLIKGFTLQPMVSDDLAHELILGCLSDATFGPVLMVGQGGIAVEVLRDRCFGLPPLNVPLAKEMIERTRVWPLLQGYRNRPAANLEAFYNTVLRLSALICACPEIREVDLNPLRVDANGAVVLDARVRLAPEKGTPTDRLLIRPYPVELETHIQVEGTSLLLRPIKPSDESIYIDFLNSLTEEDVYFRFFHAIKQWTHENVARLTQIDYDREMAFVLLGYRNEIVATAVTSADPDNLESEFAIIVRPDYRNSGLGHVLMQHLMDFSRDRGTSTLCGYVLTRNTKMLELGRELGFSFGTPDASGVVKLSFALQS